jgi:hypothetical protein
VTSGPNFFIAGAPRCGTTAMYDYLRQHPDVFMPLRKEPVYFGSDLQKRKPYLDEAGYRELFEPGAGCARRGEATVWYLYSQTAAREIHDFVPEARIIIMLRNPVDMIHSLHSHQLFTANEDIADFEAALAAEPDRAQGRRLPPGVRRPEGLLYRACGRYADHVERWLEVWGSDQLKVILYDDLSADPAGTYRQTLDFLQVDPSFAPDFAVVNQNKGVRSGLLRRIIYHPAYVAVTNRLPGPISHAVSRAVKRANIRYAERPRMSAELRSQLTAEFAPDVERLAGIIGRDLSAWTAVRQA